MVGIQHQIGLSNIFNHAGLFLPRQFQQGVDIVPHHCRFRRHRRHHFQFFQFRQSLAFSFFAHACSFDVGFQLVQLGTFVFLAQFLMDGFNLFVQVILALGFFHLPLHTAADTFFHLQDIEFGIKLAEQEFHPFGHIDLIQNHLARLQFQLQMGSNGIGQSAVVLNSGNRAQHFRRNLFVQLGKLIEFIQQRAAQRLHIPIRPGNFFDFFHMGEKIIAGVFHRQRTGAADTLHQHLYCAVRKFQHLQDIGHRPHLVQAVGFRFFIIRIFLREQKNRLIVFHCLLQRGNRFGAADKQRQNHMGVYHHIAQR